MAAVIGNNCVKQISLLRKDMDALASGSLPSGASHTSLKGSIGVSLTSLTRLLDDFESLTKAETNPAKQDRQYTRLKDLRTQHAALRQQFDKVSRQRDEAQAQSDRQDLLGRRPHANATPDNPYANSKPDGPVHGLTRHEGNLKEASALNRVSGMVDEYIEAGLASLGDLREQTATLKGTQKRLRDVALKMGLSSETIRFIEQRTKGDRYVFYGGCIVTLVAFYFILRYFG
jgi:hypothetical protein